MTISDASRASGGLKDLCPFLCVCVSRLVVSNCLQPHGLEPTRLLCPWNSPGENTRMSCHFLLQGIFLTQGSNLGLLHCQQILYHLSHQGRRLVTNRKTVQLPNHLLCKILRTCVIEPADICSETVWYFKNLCVKECRDSPRVKTMPSKAEGVGLIPGWGARTPRASQPKTQNIKQKQYAVNSIKTLKMVYVQEKSLKK